MSVKERNFTFNDGQISYYRFLEAIKEKINNLDFFLVKEGNRWTYINK